MASTYHEHAGPACNPGMHESCPNPPGLTTCEEVDTDLFGCTHVFDTELAGATPQALEESLAASDETIAAGADENAQL